MLRSPLEQFIIIPLFSFQLGAIDLSFTNSALVFSLIGFTSYYLYLIISSGKRAVLSPTNYELALETYYDFVLNLTKENLGKNLKYFNFIFSLFSLIAFSNAFGFIPYVFCTTSHVIISLALSVSIWLSVIFIGLQLHKLNWFSAFMPSGTPLILALLLVPIELISFSARAISLGFRLSINLMSGHLLTAIIADFAYKMFLSSNLVIKMAGFLPLIVIFALMFLEFGILLMQSFIFSVLTSIYISEAIDLH